MSWTLINGSTHRKLVSHQEWQLDSADDISNPPAEALRAAPGSKAWTGNYSHIFNKQNDGTWVDILAEE